MNLSKGKFDVIVYGDFLARNTAQAQDTLVMINVLKRRGLLGSVICRDFSSSLFSKYFKKAIVFGSLFPKALTFLEVITGMPTRNFSQNALFDFFASRKIRSQYVIASTMGLKRCLTRSQQLGGVYIEFEVTENPKVFIEKLGSEERKFNIQSASDKKEILLRGIWTARHADFLVCLSESSKETFVSDGYDPEKIFILPITISNEDQPYPMIIVEKITFLYLAHTQILKGLQYLLEAWVLGGLYKNANLLIGGFVDEDTRKIIRKYEKVDGVSFLGNVTNVQNFFSKGHVFLSPTKSEGLGRSVLEAMAAGLPVIVTKYCGVMIRDGVEGLTCSQDPEDILEKMRFFLENKEQIMKMGTNARKTFELFYSKKNVTSKAEEIICRITSGIKYGAERKR